MIIYLLKNNALIYILIIYLYILLTSTNPTKPFIINIFYLPSKQIQEKKFVYLFNHIN